ncbi:MAG: hypothetical protein OYK82_04660 [Gammaproteobacteria bacterium]|nr:hypothetical protein [Gammaproteobacteria bacterium]
MQAGVSGVALVVRRLETDAAAPVGLESGGPRIVVVSPELDRRSRGVDAELERPIGPAHVVGGDDGIVAVIVAVEAAAAGTVCGVSL